MRSLRLTTFCVIGLLCCSLSIAQEETNTSRISISGTVTDADGNTISGANLILASPIYRSDVFPTSAIGKPVFFASAKTDQDGKFNIGFNRDDKRFLQPGKFKLLIHRSESVVDIQQLPIHRLTLDLPLNISLKPKSSTRLRLLDSAGQPAGNFQVSVARYQNVALPFQLSQKFGEMTDKNGWVELPSIDEENLQAIYAVATDKVHQRISVQSKNNELTATLIKTAPAEIQFRLPDDADNRDLGGISMVIPSVVNSNNSVGELSDYSWVNGTTDKNGVVKVASLGLGLTYMFIDYPNDFPFRIDPWESKRLQISTDPSLNNVVYELQHSVPVRGRVVNQSNGQPITRIFIDGSGDFHPLFTDEDGNFEFHLARGGTVDLFTHSAFGDYVLPESYYRRTTALDGLEVVTVKTCELIPAAVVTGKVKDSEGQPVAGGVIVCQKQIRGNNFEVEFLSDRNGNFQFRDCKEGEEVQLSATFESQSTTEPTFYRVVAAADGPELTVEAQVQASFGGTILDRLGEPISGAVINIVKGETSAPEGYGSKSVKFEPLFEDDVIKSDAGGSFTTAKTTDFRNDIWVKIEAANHWDFVSPPMDIRSKVFDGDVDEQTPHIELGRFRVITKPVRISSSLRVVDEDGTAIDEARVLLVGGRTNKVSGLTDVNGEITLQPLDGRQVLAIAKPGFRYHFQIVDSPKNLKEVELVQIDSKNSILPNRKIAADSYSVEEIRQLATDLMAKIEAPIAGQATHHRMFMYSRCLAASDPDALMQLLQYPDLEERSSLLSFLSETLIIANPDFIPEIVAAMPDAQSRGYFWVSLIDKVADPDLKEQCLSEAVIASREMSGTSRALLVSLIANALLKDGQLVAAKELVRDAWETIPGLKAILSSNEPQREAIGIARYFAPVMAIEDIDIAFELIEKNSQGQEQPGQKTQALFYLAESDPVQFKQRMSEYGYDKLSDYGFSFFLEKFGAPTDLDVCRQLLGQLPVSVNKGTAQAKLAQALFKKGDQRGTEVFEAALRTLGSVQLNSLNTDYLRHASGTAIEMLEQPTELTDDLKAKVAFESLWLWSGTNLEARNFGLPARVTKGLARFDSELARAILEPCFEDFSWLHDGLHGHMIHQGVGFYRNETLAAAAQIDPAWAVEVCSQLIEGPYANDQLRQLELANSVCEQLTKLIVAKSAKQ